MKHIYELQLRLPSRKVIVVVRGYYSICADAWRYLTDNQKEYSHFVLVDMEK